jgi:hypothetical protein
MLTFGVLSSVFDYLTFSALQYILRSGPEQLRTGWLIEAVSLLSSERVLRESHLPAHRLRPTSSRQDQYERIAERIVRLQEHCVLEGATVIGP